MAVATTSSDAAGVASRLRLQVTRLARTLRREDREGLSPTMLAALASIERHGPVTAGSLAVHEQVRKPTATRMIAELARRALIERRPDQVDGRYVWLQVTPEGRRLVHRVRRRRDEYLARQLGRLPTEDVETLDRAAEILEGIVEGAS